MFRSRSRIRESFGLGAFLALAALSVSPSVSGASIVRNSGTISINNPQGYNRVFVLSDVHGHLGNLIQLLQSADLIDSSQNWSAGSSLLLVVGDSVDKGPNSIGVLDLWIKLAAQATASGGRLVHLLGNHEAEFLADPTRRHDEEDRQALAHAQNGVQPSPGVSPWSHNDDLIDEIEAKGIDLATLTGTSSPRGAFLHAERLAARVGKWLFFHAGLFPAQLSWHEVTSQAAAKLSSGAYGDPFFSDDNSMLEAKDWWIDSGARQAVESHLATLGLFGIVFGHQPKAFGIADRIGSIDQGKLIKIDSGMADSAGSNPGEILVFSHPADLNQVRFPTAYVIQANGKTHLLAPQND